MMLPSLSQLKALSKHVPPNRFKKLSGKKRRCDIPLEDILLEQHPSQPYFNSFVTHKNRLIPWLLALVKHFTAKQNVNVSLAWYDEGGKEVNITAPFLSKVRINTHSTQAEASQKPTFSFTIYFKTGLITVQGESEAFGREEFQEIRDSVTTLTTEDNSPPKKTENLNITTVTSSPEHGAAANQPHVSPIQSKPKPPTEVTDDEYESAVDDDEDGKDGEDEPTVMMMNKSLSGAYANLDGTVLTLKQTVEQSVVTQQNVVDEVKSISSSQNAMKNDVSSLLQIIGKIDGISSSQDKVKSDISDIKKILRDLVTTVEAIKDSLKQNAKSADPPKPVLPSPKKDMSGANTPADENKNNSNAQPSVAPNQSASSAPASAQPTAPMSTSPQQPVGTDTRQATSEGIKRDNTTNLNKETQYLVISDSITRDVDERKLDPSGLTQVKTFGGITTNGLARKLEQFPKSKAIRKVIAHVGFNDSSCVNPMTRTSVALLINGIKMKFPNAQVTLSAALPTREGMTPGITAYNEACSAECSKKNGKTCGFWNLICRQETLVFYSRQ